MGGKPLNVLLALVGIPLALILPGLSTLLVLAPLPVAAQGRSPMLGGRHKGLDLLEWIYLVPAVSLAISGWLGLLLAQLGIFTIGRLLGILFLYSLAMGFVTWRRGWLNRPRLSLESPLLLVAFLVVTAIYVALAFRPFELILGPRDAAVYPAIAAQTVQQGGIQFTDPLVAELAQVPVENQERFFSQFFPPQHEGRFYYTNARMPGLFIAEPEKGTIVPQFYHLYPTWLAIGFGLLGLKAGLFMTPYLTLLGGMGVFMVARRLFGSWPAMVAYLLLSLNTIQVWFARYSVSEGSTQFLLFLAIYALVRLEEPEGESLAFWGLLSGMAVGLIGLVRVDFFFLWALLLPYFAYLFVSRRFFRAHRLFLLSLGLLAVHTVLQMTTLAWNYTLNSYYHRIQDWYTLSWMAYPLLTPTLRRYFSRRTPLLQQHWRLLYELGVPLFSVGLLYWLRRSSSWRSRMGNWLQRHRRLLLGGMAGLFLLGCFYAYIVRPGILNLEVLRHPLQNRLALEGYIGAPVPEGRAANMVRLGWYFSPLGIALGVAGIAAILFRESSRRSWLLLLAGIFYTVFFTYEVFGEPHHVYIMRRYLPAVVPILCIGMACALDWLRQLPRWQRLGKIAAWGLGALMACYLAYTGIPFFRHTEYRGAIDQVEGLAQRFNPDDVLLLINDQRDAPFTIATPLQYLFERNALVIIAEKPSSPLIEEQIRNWQSDGREVYLLVGNDGGRLNFTQTQLRWLDRFELAVPEFEQLTTQKPHNSYILHQPFGLYAPEPWDGSNSILGSLPVTVDLGMGGYEFQLAGFHQDEIAESGPTYCWTKGEGVLRLPWPVGDELVKITLRLAGGKRPEELGPAWVRPCVGDTCLDPLVLEEAFTTHSFSLPAQSLERDEGGTVRLALHSPPWRQIDYGMGGDTRNLGVQLDWVRVEVGE
jgi:hypothetical protein